MEGTEENVIEIQYEHGHVTHKRHKACFDKTESGNPDNDTSNTITFWNIEQDDSIVKLDTFNDDMNNVHDAAELVEKLEQGEGVKYRKCETKLARNRYEVAGNTVPTNSQSDASLGQDDGNCGNIEEKDTNRDTGNVSTDDSDIVEINVNSQSTEKGDKTVITNEIAHKKDLIDNIFQVQKPEENVPTFDFARTEGNHQFNNTANVKEVACSWNSNIDDPENIFTKSLILSGITEPHLMGTHKRPHDEDSPERQSKRVKIEPVTEQYDSEKPRNQVGSSPSVENSEFCPPVAVVFPLEPDIKKFEEYRQYACHMKEDNVKSTYQMFDAQTNSSMQELISKNAEKNHCTDKVLLSGQNGSAFNVGKNQSENDSQCEKNSLRDSLGNFEFDFEIQESKDDFSIDITPTINPLDEYEDVLAGLIADVRKSIKEPANSHVNTSVPLNQPSVALKDQINCVPPNVTFSTACKSVSSALDKLQASSYPQSIAKNIEHIMASGTMRPNQYTGVSGNYSSEHPFSYGVQRQVEGRPNSQTIPVRNDGTFNPLQTFSLHNDSNLLRKMISTPVTDLYEGSVSNTDIPDNVEKASDERQSMQKEILNSLSGIKTENSYPDSVKRHSGDSLQADKTKPSVPGVTDKPAMSEQVRARITLHHTGTKEEEQDNNMEIRTESKIQSSYDPTSALQLQCPPHLQQPLTVKTNTVYNRGMQDVLLQHSLRRRQLAMNQHYGEQNVPSSQYASQVYPSGFPHGNRHAENQTISGAGPFLPTSHGHPGNAAVKYDMNMLNKGHIGQIPRQRTDVEPTHGSFNPHHMHMANTLNNSTIVSHEHLRHQRQQSNLYSHPNFRNSMMPSGMPVTMPSHMHPHLKHQNIRFTNGTSRNTSNPSPSGQGAHPAAMSMQRLPGQLSKDQYPHLAHQHFSHPQTSMYHRHQLHHRPQLDRTSPAAGGQMPYMADYKQLAHRVADLSDNSTYASMNPAMRSHIDDRLLAAGAGQSDTGMQSGHQYPRGMSDQARNFDVR